MEGTSYHQQPGTSACLLGVTQREGLASLGRPVFAGEQSQLVNIQVGEAAVASLFLYTLINPPETLLLSLTHTGSQFCQFSMAQYSNMVVMSTIHVHS